MRLMLRERILLSTFSSSSVLFGYFLPWAWFYFNNFKTGLLKKVVIQWVCTKTRTAVYRHTLGVCVSIRISFHSSVGWSHSWPRGILALTQCHWGSPEEQASTKGEGLFAIVGLNCQSWQRAVSVKLFLSHGVRKWYSFIILKHLFKWRSLNIHKGRRNEPPMYSATSFSNGQFMYNLVLFIPHPLPHLIELFWHKARYHIFSSINISVCIAVRTKKKKNKNPR